LLPPLTADSGDNKEALDILKEAEPHLPYCPSLVPQYTALHHSLLQDSLVQTGLPGDQSKGDSPDGDSRVQDTDENVNCKRKDDDTVFKEQN